MDNNLQAKRSYSFFSLPRRVRHIFLLKSESKAIVGTNALEDGSLPYAPASAQSARGNSPFKQATRDTSIRQLHGILKRGYLLAYGVMLFLACHSQFVYSAVASVERDRQVSPIFISPVKIHATWNNLEPYSSDELAYVLQKVTHLVGMDNHGHDFPGVIDEVLALNPAINASCSWETMSVYPVGDRWAGLNPYEETFIHSADPASLRVVPTGDGRAYIVFRIDGRALPYAREGGIGVDRYLVEWASAPDGPFNLLQEVAYSYQLLHVVEDLNYLPTRYYRVRTVFAEDQTVNAYSWVASADPALDAHFGYALLLRDKSMYSVCLGAGCPVDPAEVVIEADRNHNRIIDSVCRDVDEDGIPDQPADCERWHFTDATPIGNGFMYSGKFIEVAGLFDYRVVLESEPSVAIPSGNERYQVNGNNNRIQMHMFDNYLLWPDDQRYQTQTQRRLSDCLDLGYTGMRLDFTLADLSADWQASGLPPDWNTGGMQRLQDGVVSQLTELRNFAPDANITINGFFAAWGPAYFTYLESANGGEFEWFAFGGSPGATEINQNVYHALVGMIQSAWLGKRATAYAGDLGPNGQENHDARRKSLALYLLVADERNYYYYTASELYGALEYYPEWDVPLGNPVVPLLEMTENDFVPFEIAGLLGREFENGWTLFNTSPDPVTIRFDTSVYEVVLVGGRVPEIGGDGALEYHERTEIVLNGGDGALVLKSAP